MHATELRTSIRDRLEATREAFNAGRWRACLDACRALEREPVDSLTRGRCRQMAGQALTELGELDAAGAVFRMAFEDLEAVDRGRYLALAELSSVWQLASTGETAAARVRAGRAREHFAAADADDGIALAEQAFSYLDYADGRYTETATKLAAFAVDGRDRAAADAERWALSLRTAALLATGAVAEAARSAENLHFPASVISDWTATEARMLEARVAAHRYDARGLERLEAIVGELDALDDGAVWWSQVGRVWIYDALSVLDPAIAEHRAPELLPATHAPLYWRVAAELRAVDATPRAFRRDDRDRWVFDPDAVEIDPPADLAAAMIRHALFVRAYALDRGHQDRMAERLGYSKQHVSGLRKALGLPKRRR